MNSWIKSKQNGVLINLDEIADILLKEQTGGYSVTCYTPSGFGIVIMKGALEECEDVMAIIETKLSPEEL